MIRHRLERVAAEEDFSAAGCSEEIREYYRKVLRQLAWPGSGECRAPQSLGVTSCYDGEGVSTVAAQLAAAAASGGDHRVLLVDGNLVRPSLGRRFGVAAGPGLADVILGHQEITEAARPTTVANLSLLPAGEPNGNLPHVYDSARLTLVVESLRRAFDLIVFDMPPVGQAGSGIALARLVDRVLLVVESERVRWEVAQRTKQLLLSAEVRLAGVILNKRQHHVPEWLYRTL